MVQQMAAFLRRDVKNKSSPGFQDAIHLFEYLCHEIRLQMHGKEEDLRLDSSMKWEEEPAISMELFLNRENKDPYVLV